MKLVAATIAAVAVALGGSSLAQAATLIADPDLPCYAEQQSLLVPGGEFTPNAQVDFTRDGIPVKLLNNEPIAADPAGAIVPILTLPGLLSGQRIVNYLATDTADRTNTAALSLLVTATDVSLKPEEGKPSRVFTIRARGFFGDSKRLWVHIKRGGSSRVRNVKLARIHGPCKKARAKRRLFSASAPSGRYRLQFDAFKRYRKTRGAKAVYKLTIRRTIVPAASHAANASSIEPRRLARPARGQADGPSPE